MNSTESSTTGSTQPAELAHDQASQPTRQRQHPHANPGGESRKQHDSKKQSARRKHGPVFRVLVIIASLIALIWTVRFVHRALVFEETDDAYVTGHIHQISARIAGTVLEVLVDDNQMVKAGQVLAKIDPLEFEIALQKAKAALAQAEAQELQAHAGMAGAKADLAQANAVVAQAQAEVDQTAAKLDLANINLDRNQQLFQSDQRAVSKSEVDTTRGAARATSASLEGARADLEAAHAKAQAADAALSSSEAQLAAAVSYTSAQQAAVRDAQRELSYTTITAPVDGRIGSKSIEVGNRVQTGQAVFAIVSPEVWVVANFKETQLTKMHAGEPVEFTVDALDGRVFTGRVDSLSPATGAQFSLLPPDNATGNFTKVVQRLPVKIIPDPQSTRGVEDRLQPGLSAVVSVRVVR